MHSISTTPCITRFSETHVLYHTHSQSRRSSFTSAFPLFPPIWKVMAHWLQSRHPRSGMHLQVSKTNLPSALSIERWSSALQRYELLFTGLVVSSSRFKSQSVHTGKKNKKGGGGGRQHPSSHREMHHSPTPLCCLSTCEDQPVVAFSLNSKTFVIALKLLS